MLVPNQYIEMKSVGKLGTGKSHAHKLCVFFNFLHQKFQAEYDIATNKQVLAFVEYLIYVDRENLRILHPQESLCYSTLPGYVSAITDFYRWLDQTGNSRSWRWLINAIYRWKSGMPCFHIGHRLYKKEYGMYEINMRWLHDRMFPISLRRFAKDMVSRTKTVRTMS